jgi:hypothetical protein
LPLGRPIGHHDAMNNLDLNGPAPKAKTLEEAQQTIDTL